MGFFGLFGSKDFKKDGLIYGYSEIEAIFNAYNFGRGPQVISVKTELPDERYYAMSPENRKSLVWKSVDLFGVSYHSNSNEFPDCDDFANMAHAQVLRGAIRHGLPFSPAFFMVSYMRRGEHHAANAAIDNDGQIKLYEPQTQMWHPSLKEVEFFTGVYG